nr:importin-11 [Quercus suber]
MPSFSIEVPGEANPLTDGQLVQALRSASSSDPNQIQFGTKQLQQWEKTPGYYKTLQSAFIDHQLPIEIRYLAIIQLKNGIDKYWRKTATNAVQKDDKNAIRARLLKSGLVEPDDRLALQNALVIAKIARFEYPNDWPDAIPSLIQTLRSAQELPPLQLSRALLVLLHVVKELSTGRLQRTRQTMQAATPEIVHVLGQMYADSISFWRGSLDAQQESVVSEISRAMKMSLLAIKILRRLLVAGYEHPNRDQDVVSFWNLAQQQLGDFMQTRHMTRSSDVNLLLEKHLLQLAKLHHEMSKDHPAAFVLLPNSLELVRSYWSLAKEFGESFGSREAVGSARSPLPIGMDGDVGDDRTVTEKLALRGLLILRACLKMVHNAAQTFKYRTPTDKEEKAQATKTVKEQLLSHSLVQDIMEVIVTKYFVFRASDLREWEEEPEEWEKREEADGEDWEFSIRSCSEKLFLDLAINYKDVLVQPLLRVFYSVALVDNEDVLFKDSVYTAIGLSAPVVHEQLDFDAFIRDVLAVEVQKTKPGFNIIRRRAAILISQWISIKITERQLVYQIFQHLLNGDDPVNDQVVRVTAARQFCKVADDWEFAVDQFLPFADATLTRILHLIEEVELTETKMALLNTISVVVERMDHHISPFAERIVGLLPPLWEASGDEHLMKQAILTILARLVNAMKGQSLPLHAMVFPIIKGAVEPGSETQVYLLDDAMDLWAAILVQTPAPASPNLLQLVPYLFPIFELGSDNLRKALEIAQSYVLLAPSHMLSAEVRTTTFTYLSNLFGTLRPEANGLVCNLIEYILWTAQILGGENAVARTATDLVQTGLLRKLLEGLHGSWKAHCTTGPLAESALVDGVVETDYFSILARFILGSDLATFCQSCTSVASSIETISSPSDLNSIMKWLLEEWFSHFENIADPGRRKIMCLALTKLLQTNQPFILLNLQLLMTIWTDVVTELREDASHPSGDSLVCSFEGGATASEDASRTPEDDRNREYTRKDEVHSIPLAQWIQMHLQQSVAACGGDERFREEWLVNVDQDVLKGFGALGIL